MGKFWENFTTKQLSFQILQTKQGNQGFTLHSCTLQNTQLISFIIIFKWSQTYYILFIHLVEYYIIFTQFISGYNLVKQKLKH